MTVIEEPRKLVLDPAKSAQRNKTLNQACQAARILADFNAQDTLVLDLTKITPIADYFVVATGSSPRQMQAISEDVRVTLKKQGSLSIGTEGDSNSSWILQDYGDIVVHIFTPEARKLYDLEHLWADAPHVNWEAIAPPPAPRV